MSAAWGGQILCTDAVANEIGSPTTSLGEHRLRDVDGKFALCQILTVSEEIDFPPPRTLDAVPTTVPAQRSSFVGRGPDIAIVRRLLIDHRLVTLTGPGGTGKTATRRRDRGSRAAAPGRRDVLRGPGRAGGR